MNAGGTAGTSGPGATGTAGPGATGSPRPSAWQRRIAGEWVGRPSLFDASGAWQGFEDIRRSSVFDGGVTTYLMDGGLTGGGPLAGRFKLGAPFAFGVTDSGGDRVYTGPDFFGSGRPYGSFVDAHYYGPGWQVDLNTWNQVLPDGETQVYSSVLHQGPAVVGVFNGVYTRDPRETEALLERETRCGAVPYVLPTKQACAYRGVCETWGADRERWEDVRITIELEPVSLLVTRVRVTWSGGLPRSYETLARRDGFRSFYEGPDAWGNATAYGRANYVSLHLGGAEKLKGREFMIDAEPGMGAGSTLAVVYRLFDGDAPSAVVHGVLERR
ncbi:hypothetical protein [Planobispora longispora]|uniref:Uncharacterized protein n=1 Tax=Planobispora longispora TaxID=28887 RepID=A0A8J3RQ50_9ACTN|nr:hypothetical protein [Planobispora longispora]BFE78270.1 hypothetical protein GCM10020093_008710 [Planobispora longispora]GIH80831.1 hypothetical protein Plo01_72600 [Planobispora longispora]